MSILMAVPELEKLVAANLTSYRKALRMLRHLGAMNCAPTQWRSAEKRPEQNFSRASAKTLRRWCEGKDSGI